MKKECFKNSSKLHTEWMTFIRDVHIPEKRRLIEEIAKKEEVIGLAFAEYEKMNSNKETRRLYESRLKQLRVMILTFTLLRRRVEKRA